jgi:hypothetical protein
VSDQTELVEARTRPICPHCEATIDRIEYVQEKLGIEFTLMMGATWLIILMCPRCHKVLGSPILR